MLSVVDFLTIPQVFVSLAFNQNWLGKKTFMMLLSHYKCDIPYIIGKLKMRLTIFNSFVNIIKN